MAGKGLFHLRSGLSLSRYLQWGIYRERLILVVRPPFVTSQTALLIAIVHKEK